MLAYRIRRWKSICSPKVSYIHSIVLLVELMLSASFLSSRNCIFPFDLINSLHDLNTEATLTKRKVHLLWETRKPINIRRAFFNQNYYLKYFIPVNRYKTLQTLISSFRFLKSCIFVSLKLFRFVYKGFSLNLQNQKTLRCLISSFRFLKICIFRFIKVAQRSGNEGNWSERMEKYNSENKEMTEKAWVPLKVL